MVTTTTIKQVSPQRIGCNSYMYDSIILFPLSGFQESDTISTDNVLVRKSSTIYNDTNRTPVGTRTSLSCRGMNRCSKGSTKRLLQTEVDIYCNDNDLDRTLTSVESERSYSTILDADDKRRS